MWIYFSVWQCYDIYDNGGVCMGFFDKLQKSKGGYIFLSHSHEDIVKVREIRNRLEQDGFEPLCFFLKCLDDDSEIEDLIKREIDAREWFVFVNSENSRKSRWVTLEREYITKTNSKKIITVDINDEQSVADAIQKISHNLRIYISYSHKDEAVAKRIKCSLKDKDYLAFTAQEDIPAGAEYASTVVNAIKEASQDGCVIALITADAVKSEWVKREIVLAYDQGGNVIPVLVGDVELDRVLQFLFYNTQTYTLSENPTDEEINEMVEQMGRNILK